MKDGLFPSLIATEMETVNGLNRSRGWATAFWGNSDRNPVNRVAGSRSADPRIAPYHVLDMSWTSLLMLRWHEELEPDERLLAYASRYGDALLRLQDARGFFPAWLDRETLKPLGVLDDSPETSLSVTFLLALSRATGKIEYRDAASLIQWQLRACSTSAIASRAKRSAIATKSRATGGVVREPVRFLFAAAGERDTTATCRGESKSAFQF